MGYIKNFFLELKAWRIVNKVYKKNKADFDKIGLKKDYFGRLFRVINRSPDITLGDEMDEALLHKETTEIWSVLVKHNLIDILAYELKPLEDERQIDETHIEYEHGYLITLTPAWNLNRQYVTFWSITFVTLFFASLIGGLVYSTIHWLIPWIQTLF